MSIRSLVYGAVGFSILGCGGSQLRSSAPPPFVEPRVEEAHALLRLRMGGTVSDFGRPSAMLYINGSLVRGLSLSRSTRSYGFAPDIATREDSLRIPPGSHRVGLSVTVKNIVNDKVAFDDKSLTVATEQGMEHVLFLFIAPALSETRVYSYRRGSTGANVLEAENRWKELQDSSQASPTKQQ